MPVLPASNAIADNGKAARADLGAGEGPFVRNVVELIGKWRQTTVLWKIGVALAAVAIAIAIRMGLLGALNTRLVYITFYPAVVCAAVLSGFPGGVLATIFAAAAAHFFIAPLNDFGDKIGLLTFLISGMIISGLAEALHLVVAGLQSALHENEQLTARQRLAAIVDSMNDAVVAFDTDGRLTSWNASAEKLFGYTAAEAIGRSADLLVPAHGKLTAGESARGAFDLALAGQAFSRDTQRITKDGTIIDVNVTATRIKGPDGRVVGVSAIMRDIRDRKRNEAQQVVLLKELRRSEVETRRQSMLFQSVFESAPDSMLIVNLDRNIVDANRAALNCFGYSLDELKGQSSRLLFFSQKLWQAKGDYVASGVNVTLIPDLTFKRKDGSSFPAEMILAKILGPSGELIGHLDIIRDITQRQKREQALREMQRLESLGRLTGGIAHDFNNLLTVITGNIELVEMTTTDKVHKQYLDEAYRAASMGARLNQRLMTFARQRRLDPAPVDLNALVRSMLDLIAVSIGRNIEVKAKIGSEPAITRIDASEMENAIINIALNARDAMPKGGSLNLETSLQDVDAEAAALMGNLTPGPYVRLSISDTGVGMSPDVADRAFEPYFTTKEVGKGTGLGLTTIHGFVRQSGGDVSLYSEVGHGTTVNIYLPRVSAAGAESRTTTRDKSELPAGRGELVLVVEDNPAVRKTVLERLRRLNYEVAEADSGVAALKYLEAGNPADLVFSDVVMPGGVSGFQLAGWLHTLRPELPVLLTSGFPNEMQRENTGDGTFRLLRKPYGQAELAAAIASALVTQG